MICVSKLTESEAAQSTSKRFDLLVAVFDFTQGSQGKMLAFKVFAEGRHRGRREYLSISESLK